ncbi:type II toxin-antitoxin system PemK/MazF family toxin [Enterobacter bugandensis]|uniref:type II toxin-antitoxin system PemK/MazF family toxin n=1 Tax=Enterobacter bugandensis TaxID=881260 RepID=UPI0031D7C420|nr:type II toxin-antitoxin system PemK/MazF family toxin [Enterobacter bugandensis]
MSLKISHLPIKGDIIWCYFPERMGKMRPKPRPVIVIGVSEKKHEVMVIFGTSQKTNKLYPSEFLIAKSDGIEPFELSGLSHDTKFDFSKASILPFTTEFFGKAPRKNNIPYPKLGSVHIMYYASMHKANNNVK